MSVAHRRRPVRPAATDSVVFVLHVFLLGKGGVDGWCLFRVESWRDVVHQKRTGQTNVSFWKRPHVHIFGEEWCLFVPLFLFFCGKSWGQCVLFIFSIFVVSTFEFDRG